MRRPDGAALLVASGAEAPMLDASMVHTLGQIGEALLATGAAWQIKRLSSGTGERFAADRATLKRQIDELVKEPVRVAVLVVIGQIIELSDGPALATGPDARAYPEDATLPLAWIGKRLRGARAEHLLVVVSSSETGDARSWLASLATERAHDVVATHASKLGCPLADALLGGLCGDALDPRTGTVTFRSLGQLLQRRVPSSALQLAEISETVAQSPPLAGFWDVRRSQLATPRARTNADDDLVGSVLPGRFRIDEQVARGTFGTVYRARQLAVERDVAVKVLHADIDPSSEDGRLFVDEIRAVGRIDHTNVVRIHQADITHDGRLFYAMELLEGQDLQQLGQVPLAQAIDLVRQLLAGLGAAHETGLVHADIKPANAILSRDRVVLVDFGLARLRTTESAGGTPAYMAPEQLHEGRVDQRSDLYACALVMVALLTGWRRKSAADMVPPLDGIDESIRHVLARALEVDAAKRYQSAAELAAALAGSTAPVPVPARRLPFQQLAPITDRIYGRETEIALLVDHALYRKSVAYTAASGTGKTSLLRAGLLPRLEALGMNAIYVQCRGETSLAELDQQVKDSTTRTVIVLDQIEAEPELATIAQRYPDADVGVVISVREDHLARILSRVTLPVVRLPPLSADGARQAIVGPLTTARLAIEPALLDALLEDLLRAAAALDLGWGEVAAVYPPHLQLVCSALCDALAPGEATLTVAMYQRLGGFDAIVGEHLERVVETELGDRAQVARDIFVALVTTTQERAIRTEAELVEIAGPRTTEVLEVLRARGLLVQPRADEPSWELIHDSLVPRVQAWLDRADLARKRAVELVRYHVRRSRGLEPSLLGPKELRDLKAYGDAIDALDASWKDREGWTPKRLVERSRTVLRRQRMTYASMLTAAIAIATFAIWQNRVEEAHARHEQELRARDLGKFTLALTAFDWDPVERVAKPAPAPLTWELRDPDPADPEVTPLGLHDTVRGERDAFGEHVEAHGGPAYLVVRRGPCAPSVVPLKALPGYATREGKEPVFHIAVPTCAASRADMIDVPAGPFVQDGPGDPAVVLPPGQGTVEPERIVDQPGFAIDRLESTNAAYALMSSMSSATGYAHPIYPRMDCCMHASEPMMPVTGIDWNDARRFCAFMGKRLPTTEEWMKAMRGPNDATNPMPRRSLPWGREVDPTRANIADPTGVSPVGSHPGDRSFYGVLDMAGSVMEWTSTPVSEFRITQGGNFTQTKADELLIYVGVSNQRSPIFREFGLGVRCAR